MNPTEDSNMPSAASSDTSSPSPLPQQEAVGNDNHVEEQELPSAAACADTGKSTAKTMPQAPGDTETSKAEPAQNSRGADRDDAPVTTDSGNAKISNAKEKSAESTDEAVKKAPSLDASASGSNDLSIKDTTKEQDQQCQKDPEGSRTAASQFTSQRFDEKMLQDVMQGSNDSEEEEENKTLDLPSTIPEETQHESSSGNNKVQVSSAPPNMPQEDTTPPSLPSETILTDAQQASADISLMDEGSPNLQQPSPLLEEDVSSMLNDDLQSIYSVQMHQQPHTFTAPAQGHVMQPMPGLVHPSPAHMVQVNDLQRASLASAGSNGYHHYSGMLQQPNEDMSIPHMPPLALPSSSAHGPASVHANGYHISAMALAPTPASQPMLSGGGKRRIHLRLEEDVRPREPSLFSSFRKHSILRKKPLSSPISESEPSNGQKKQHWVGRGTLTVSWYEGTSSLELQEHVRNSVVRKLHLEGTATKLADFRILDDSIDPPEEIVLCPFIPSGSRLLLRFTTKDAGGAVTPVGPRLTDYSGPPDSPSAAPSPYPRTVDLGGLGLNANQLALLGARLKGLQMPSPDKHARNRPLNNVEGSDSLPRLPAFKGEGKSSGDNGDNQDKDSDEEDNSKDGSNFEVASLHPEDPVQKSLREITQLLVADRKGTQRYAGPRQEKRQVIFVLANYFVLFLSFLAISAEIQARAPGWHAAMEGHLKNVQSCSKDQESLYGCVENGDFAGLIASVLLWISRSAATKRIFLFGFETPKKLWTVVYESLVTAFCWGFSYMFIRRGMNPDTNRNFLQKYWKDAVYGSLAGFNAAFMKHVLKNLIPQEAIEDALQDRQLKILSWLPSFS